MGSKRKKRESVIPCHSGILVLGGITFNMLFLKRPSNNGRLGTGILIYQKFYFIYRKETDFKQQSDKLNLF